MSDPNPMQTDHSDDARRELADELEFATSHYPDNHLVTVGFTAKNWRILLSALRSDPARGAEEMREKAAFLVGSRANGFDFVAGDDQRGPSGNFEAARALRDAATAIRALPLPKE